MAVLLLLLGTLAGSAAGRVLYQMALTATQDDNGYVTMFFLLIPALSSLISFTLSWWIPGLQFVPSTMFFIGLALVTISLLMLWLASWRSQLAGSHVGVNTKTMTGSPLLPNFRGGAAMHDDRP
jgi:hypothetical protein